MKNELQLNDLYLGNVDAKNELIDNSSDQIERFENSFLMPENIILKDFLTLERYFIIGLKGTGKTALLRYIGLKADEMSETYSSIVLFKSDFTEDDRKDFARAAKASSVDIGDIPNEQDFLNVWFWFFHRHIVKMVEKQNLTVFNKDNIWKQYKACILSPIFKEEDSGFYKFFPILKRGSVEVDVNFSCISGKLGLNFEFANLEKTQIKFNYLVSKANDLFSKLSPGNGKLYILLDELELSLNTPTLYNRDARIIRDVVIAIEKLNNISRKNNYGIYIIAAIRSEVLTAVSSLGKEINKITSDFGIPILWHQSGGDLSNHPILKIILKRISSSEKFHGLPYQSPDQLWKKYFPELIQRTPAPIYILESTWYRPRDVIRLLGLAKKTFPHKRTFDHQVFDAIRKQYSTESWIELSEELKTSFKNEEIEGIKRIFYGYKSMFSYDELDEHASSIKITYSEVNDLLKKHPLGLILSRLYKIGFIGNITLERGRPPRYRSFHRGDDEVLLEKDMIIHRGLMPYFSV